MIKLCGKLYHLMRFYDCFIARNNFAHQETDWREHKRHHIRGLGGVCRAFLAVERVYILIKGDRGRGKSWASGDCYCIGLQLQLRYRPCQWDTRHVKLIVSLWNKIYTMMKKYNRKRANMNTHLRTHAHTHTHTLLLKVKKRPDLGSNLH